MKVEKNINGGGFFDWFTRKKTEIERVWDNHIEKREVFINELSLIIKARNATCKDREANATRKALSQLKLNPKEASVRMEKLLLSALSNWEVKNEGKRMDEAKLYVSEVKVDSGRMLKRIQPAPQGRAHRIRKRSNHVTMVINELNSNMVKEK